MMFQIHRRRGELSHFHAVITFSAVFLILVGSIAAYDTSISCPGIETLQASTIPGAINLTNGTGDSYPPTSPWWDPFGVFTYLSGVWSFVGVFFTGCTGVPWEIYVLFMVIPSLIIMIYLYQLVRSGG